jgi:hypothetical protein
MKWYRIAIALTAVLFVSGCAFFQPVRELKITPAEKVSEVREILSLLKTQNESLKNFKGIGHIRVFQNGVLQLDQRVAWIGEKPLKFSIAVLISGYPAVKLATDGNWLYYLEVYGQDTIFRKLKANDPSLKKLISIPIPASDIIALLAGQIPMPEFDSAELIPENAFAGPVLILRDKWWGVRQKLYYDEKILSVRQVDVFNRSGSLRYRAQIEELQWVDGFKVPSRLSLSSPDGAHLQLDIDRYWVNVDLPPSVFVLKPPE